MKFVRCWLVWACWGGLVVPLAAREWTDDSGVFKLEAELVEVQGDRVQLRKPDGQIVTVPLRRLSEADRGFVRSWKGPAAKTAVEPAAKLTAETADSAGRIEKALKSATSFDFLGTPLHDVCDFLSDQHDVPFVIDTRALDDSGIGTDTPVTAKSRQGDLSVNLTALLEPLDLRWLVRHDVLLVTTKEVTETDLDTRVYKLLRPEPRDHGAPLPLDPLTADLLRNIEPQSWDQVGGPASIAGLSLGALVVAQTQANHRLIEKHYGDLLLVTRSPRTAECPGLVGANVERTLAEPTRLEFIETPLTQVVEYLGAQHKLEITLDAKALDDVGIGQDTPITLSLKRIRLSSALSLLLRPLGLTWTADQTGVRITTPEGAESTLTLVAYRVDDLAPGGQMDELIEAITSCIAPQSWEVVGGSGGIGRGVRGTLDVRQSYAVQRQVAQLLADLRQPPPK